MLGQDIGGILAQTVTAYLQKASDLEDVRDIKLTANCYEVHLDKIRDLLAGYPSAEFNSKNESESSEGFRE